MKLRRRRAGAGRRADGADLQAGAEWGAQRAQGLWRSLYAPHGLVVDGRTIVELGCSWGYMLRFLGETFTPRQLIGIDQRRAWDGDAHGWDWPALGDRLTFRGGDLAADSLLAPTSVDAVICSSVLEYMSPETVEANLARCREILRPGGEMILRTRCFTSANGADLQDEIDLPYVHLLYGEDDIAAWLNDYGRPGAPQLNWLTATTYATMFVRAGFEIVDLTRRMNSRAPHVRERVAAAFPDISDAELGVSELDVHLVRPVTADDLGGLGTVTGGSLGALGS